MNSKEQIAKKPSFTAAFFKRGGYLGALLTVAIVALIVIVNYDFNLLARLKSDNNLLLFTLITIGYSLLLYIVYACVSAKTGAFTLASQTCVGFMPSGILFALYVYLVLGEFTLLRIAIAAGLFVFGLITTIISAVGYKNGEKTVHGYFLSVVKKFSFPAVIILSTVIVCVSYLLANPTFVIALYTRSGDINYINIPAYVFAGLAALTAIFSIGSKNAKVFDLFLISAALSLPAIFLDIFFINGAPKSQLIIFSALAVADVLLIILRKFAFFKPAAANDTSLYSGSFKSFSKEYGFLAAITFGAAIAIAVHVLYVCDFVPFVIDYLTHKKGAAVLSRVTPILIVAVLLALIILWGILVSLLSLKSKKANLCDFVITASAIAGLAGIPFAFIYGTELWIKIAFIAAFALSALLFIIRFSVKRK